MKSPRLACVLGVAVLSACGCSSMSHTDKAAPVVPSVAGTAHGLGMTDVVQLTQSHVSDDVIISQIRGTGSMFRLSAEDLIWLKQNGVSDTVLREMQATAAVVAAPGPVVTAAAPVYVVEPPPPPVYVGFGYGGYRRHW